MTSPIIGIPTTRVTQAFVRDQTLRQTQESQLALSKLQAQLASGYRYEIPSEDPIASMQVQSLQRLLLRKNQVKTNIQYTQSALDSTDSAMKSVFDLVVNARSLGVSVVGTTVTSTQRKAVAQQLNQTISQLINIGNQEYRGQYLFSGSESIDAPFRETATGMVEYMGNTQNLSTYSDINLLTISNVTGDEAFGVISAEVKGTAPVIPSPGNLTRVADLTYETRLTDLRQGQGISKGSITIADGLNNPDGSPNEVTVDLSGAKTIGDIAAMIKAHPPNGRQLYVEVTADRLTIQLDPTGGGNLTIREVGSGTVAEELGIRNLVGTGTSPIVGRPLDPILRTTTSLDDMFGSYAATVVHSMGTDNDVRLVADVMGQTTSNNTGGMGTIDLNGITVQFVRTAGVVAGAEVVHPVTAGVLQVDVAADGTSRAINVVNAINLAHAAQTVPFTAEIDPLDDVFGGLAYLDVAPSNVTRDGYGQPLDIAHGLQIVNNAGEYTIDLSAAESLDDVLNIINGSSAGVIAEINETRNGINVRSKVSGCDFEIGENGGQTATQLGIRSFTGATTLSELNYGMGVHVAENATDLFAEAKISSTSQNGGVTLRAKKVAGDPTNDCWNNFTFSMVNTGDDPPTVTYNAVTRTVTVGITPGTTTANDVKAAINANPAIYPDFEVVLGFNNDKSISDGTGLVDVGSTVTAGGAPKGNDFVITRSDGVDLYLDVSGEQTIGDVIDAINNNPNNVASVPGGDRLYARLAVYGNGIELVDRSGGTGQMVVKANTFSHAAIDLGLIPDGQTQSNAAVPDHAADFITAGPHNDIIIHGRDPSSPIDGVQVIFTHASTGVDYNENTRILTVGLTAGETAAQAVDRINNSAAGTLFAAYLDPTDCSSGLGLVADNALPYTMAGGSGTTRSAVTAVIPGLDNDLIFNSVGNGTVYNNYDINFVDIPGSGAIAFTHTALPTDVLTINYDSTAVGMRTANDVVAAWSNAANWIPPADPMRTGVSVRIDRTDGPPNIGDGVVGNPTGTLDPLTTGVTVLTGEDVHPLETEGIFSAILRLRDALNSDDVQGVQRAIDELLDPATTNMNYTRASLGARQQGLEVVQSRLATEYVELKVSLSDNHDADLAQVVSDMASRQVAYEASLMAMGKIMQMSLLNYL